MICPFIVDVEGRRRSREEGGGGQVLGCAECGKRELRDGMGNLGYLGVRLRAGGVVKGYGVPVLCPRPLFGMFEVPVGKHYQVVVWLSAMSLQAVCHVPQYPGGLGETMPRAHAQNLSFVCMYVLYAVCGTWVGSCCQPYGTQTSRGMDQLLNLIV